MSANRKYIILSIILMPMILLTLYLVGDEKNKAKKFAETHLVNKEDNERREMVELNDQLDNIKTKQRLLESKISELQIGDERSAEKSKEIEEQGLSEANAMTREERRAAAVEEYENHIAFLNDSIEKEGIDQKWSDVATNKIYEAFGRENTIGLDVVGAECRSTLCRIDLQAESDGEERDNSFRNAIHALWEGEKFFVVREKEATIYISKEGQGLPQEQKREL